MKQSLPYTILLILAVLCSVMLVLNNFVWRERFPVSIEYSVPMPNQLPAEKKKTSSEHEDGITEHEKDNMKNSTQQPEEDWEQSSIISVTFPLDLNAATIEELEFVPKIGNITAQRIVQYRDVLGGYTALEQLMEIKGIGESTFASISPYLYIPQTEEDSVPEEMPQQP